MKKHSFNQEQIEKLSKRGGFTAFRKMSTWNSFIGVTTALQYKVRVTGGNFLTHEISCSEEEFEIVLELTREVV